jgi:hypothetical protein
VVFWVIIRVVLQVDKVRRNLLPTSSGSMFVGWAIRCVMQTYFKHKRPPLWSGGQSFWLQNQRSGFDSLRYQISREVVGLKRGPLCLVSTIEELLGKKSSGCGLENSDYARRDPPLWPRVTLYPQTLALTSPTSGGRSVGIVRSRTQATEFSVSLESWTDPGPGQ